jgi:20S proteasome subunit beta 2
MTEIHDKYQNRRADVAYLQEMEEGGFSFDNYQRNNHIFQQLGSSASSVLPKAWKTGTTIVGIIFKDGVVLGADTRATGGSEVVDKNCDKIHYLAPNIWCCGAGTAADTEKTTELIASNLELLRLSTGTQSRVVTALTLTKRMLYKYQGNISAALILGGVDCHGPHLYSIHPHGSSQRLPYTTMGSGSLAAMAVFESRYTEDMEEDKAMELVRDSVRAGIFNDLGSGSNVDITVIRRDGTLGRHRGYQNAAGNAIDYKSKYPRPTKLIPPPGATFVIEESFKPHKKLSVVAAVAADDDDAVVETAEMEI